MQLMEIQNAISESRCYIIIQTIPITKKVIKMLKKWCSNIYQLLL